MIRLLRVELTRLRSRRAVLLLVVAAIVVPVVLGVAAAWNTRPASEAEQAEVAAQIERDSNNKWVKRDLERCVEKPEEWGLELVEGDDLQQQCEDVVLPQPEWYGSRSALDVVYEREEGSGIAVAVVLGLVMLLAGATYAGHDWASGSISNQVIFEPRRLRVWAAKAVAVTAVAGVVAGVVATSYWLALAAVARGRDIDLGDGVLLDNLQMGWRAAALAAGLALVGYALAMLLRSTVGTLGVVFAVAIVGGILIAALGIDPTWDPAKNLQAFVWDGATYWAPAPCPGAPDGAAAECEAQKVLSLRHGLSYGVAGMLPVLGLSAWLFQRRDVG